MRSTPISVLTPVCLALAACGASQPARPSAARPSPVLTAPTVASTPAARALPRIQLARLRTTRQSFCDAAATTTTAGDNFCQLQLVLPFDDGRILVAGAFRGSVRIGTRTLRSRGMQNALAVMYAPDGSIAWLRTNGAQWHNNIVHAVPLADGRIAVAGIAANGFHPSLSVRPTQRNLEFNAERPFVGVLTAQGEWAWLRDWNTPVGDLRAAPDGGFVASVTLPTEANTTHLLRRATEIGLLLTPGQRFFADPDEGPSPDGDRFVRLPFCAVTPEQIDEGVRRLASLL